MRPVWRQFIEHFARLAPEDIARRFARGDQYLRDAGVFFRQYGTAGPNERAWPLAHIPVVVEEAEASRVARGLVQRAHLLEALAADLYGAEPARRRGPPARPPDRRQPRMAAPAGRPHPARRPLPALPRLRARPRPGRRLVGARRPHPGALGRRLRAREPGRHLAHLLRPLRRGARPPPRRLLPHLPRCAPGPRRQPRRARRHPDAGAAHRHLLRARLDRPLPRLHAARRRGPDGRARPGHGAHRRRSAPHQRPLAPARLRLRRPARARRRLPPRHPRPRRRRARRHRHPRQRARLRRPRDPRAPRLHAAHRPGAARRGSDPAQHRHLVVRPAGRARACPRQQGPDDDRLGALHPPAVRDRRDHRPRPAVPRQGQALVRRLARDRRRRPRRTGGRHPLDHPGLRRRRLGAAADEPQGVPRPHARRAGR